MSEFIHILLIEDNPGDARLLMDSLREFGNTHFVLKWEDRLGKGLEHLRREVVDAVLLDLNLPDSHGLHTLAKIQQQDPNIPVVILTGLDDEELAVKAVQSGAQDYLIKGQVDELLLSRSLRYSIERHRTQSALRDLSLKDSLTGLYNRRGFLALAEQQVNAAQRTGSRVSLIFADIDSLKNINDHYGHTEGDGVLRQVATLLKKTFRKSDIVARLGGDEFVVLLTDVSDKVTQRLIRRLRETLEAYNHEAGNAYRVALSFGAVTHPSEEGPDLSMLMSRADTLMYREKKDRQEFKKTAAAGGRPN